MEFKSTTLTTGGFESRVQRLLRDTEAHRKQPRDVFDVPAFRRQESVIISLNLTAMVGVVIIYAAFHSLLGDVALQVLIAFGARIFMQLAELLYLLSRFPLSPRVARFWAHLAVWLHVAFVMLICWLERSEDSHYIVLMLIPVVAAAFRFGPWGLAATLLVLSSVSFAEVWVTDDAVRQNFTDAEWFELATVVLAYVVVAIMLRTLVVQLRQDQRRLRFSLNALERTRDLMVRNERLAAVGELASGIAHEIRNPVAMIASSISMLKGGNVQADSRMLDIVRQESKRLEQLTSDFLAYARDKPAELQVTDLGATLGYLTSLAEAWAAEKQVTIETQCPRGAHAAIDRYQMHQALLNLLRNAVDASEPGSAIIVTAAVGSDVVSFHVANRGEPIPDDLANRMFEPFVSRKHGGTGLGLAIARRVAEAHGGQLELTMNSGGWVCLSLTVPIGIEPTAAPHR
ncbi:MAG: PAS domain-containing sensor histidine kinase [Planctomycetota bacterium]